MSEKATKLKQVAFLRNLTERIELQHFTQLTLALLTYLRLKAHPFNGTLMSNATRLAQLFTNGEEKRVQEALGWLRAQHFIWYAGMRHGQQLYLIAVEGYECIGRRPLDLFNKKGELIPSARTYLEKIEDSQLNFSTPRRTTPPKAPAITSGADVGASGGVKPEDPPENGSNTEGSRGGIDGSKGLTLPGLSPTEGGQFRRVLGGASGEAKNEPVDHSVKDSILDPPIVPPGGTGWDSPPSGEGAKDTGSRPPPELELIALLQRRLRDVIPDFTVGPSTKAELRASRELLELHGEAKVTEAIEIVVQDTFWRCHVQSFPKLKAKWNTIMGLKEKKVKESGLRRRSSDGEAQGDSGGARVVYRDRPRWFTQG